MSNPDDTTRIVGGAAPTILPSRTPPDGRPPADEGDSALPVGTRLGEFEITGLIGKGGFGIVYLAHDLSLERRVAIKEYMPMALARRIRGVEVSVKSERHDDTFEAGRRSFINEAKLLARYDHPALVKVYRFWEANGTAYMVMHYYEGITLSEALRQRGAPDERWLLAFLQQLLEALGMIHAERCYHRDIAPDNILLLHNDRPVLLDFGAARRVIGDMTHALTVILKPGFAPLEQYADTPDVQQGPWTDLYALAAVVYYAITGKAPAPSVARIMNDSLTPLAQAAAGRYSDTLLRAIDRALAVRPNDRPQSVQEMLDELGLAGTEYTFTRSPIMPAGWSPQSATASKATPPRTTRSGSTATDGGTWKSQTGLPHQPAPSASGDASAPMEPPPSTEPWKFTRPFRATESHVTASSSRSRSASGKAKPRRLSRNAAVLVGIVLIATLGAVLVGRNTGRTDTTSTSVAPQEATEQRAPASAPQPVAAASQSHASSAPAPSPPDAEPSPQRVRPSTNSPASTNSTTSTPSMLGLPETATRSSSSTAGFQLTAGDVLDTLLNGRSPGLRVDIETDRSTIRIGRDRLRFRVRTDTSGYLYVFMVGTEAKTVSQLFPNSLDADNRIAAGTELALPRRGMSIVAAGPPGLDQFVVMVSPEQRDFGPAGLQPGDPFASFDIVAAREAVQAGGMGALTGKPLCEPTATDCGKYAATRFVITEVER